MSVRTSYDAEDDILVLRMSDKPIVRETSQDWNTCISYAADGTVVEVVVLEASQQGAMTMNKTFCPVCGEMAVIHAVCDLPYSYKGQSTVIAQVAADWCDACGESMTEPDETGRVMQAMAEFQREVNAAHSTQNGRAGNAGLGVRQRRVVQAAY